MRQRYCLQGAFRGVASLSYCFVWLSLFLPGSPRGPSPSTSLFRRRDCCLAMGAIRFTAANGGPYESDAYILPLCAALGIAVSALAVAPAAAQPAGATLDRCRETAGRAFVMSCMQDGGGSLESCRAKAAPAIRRCMAAGGGAPAARQESAGPDTGKAKLAILDAGAGGRAIDSLSATRWVARGRFGVGTSRPKPPRCPRDASAKAQGGPGRHVPRLDRVAMRWRPAGRASGRGVVVGRLRQGAGQPGDRPFRDGSFTIATTGAKRRRLRRFRLSSPGRADGPPRDGSTIAERPPPTPAALAALTASSCRMGPPYRPSTASSPHAEGRARR